MFTNQLYQRAIKSPDSAKIGNHTHLMYSSQNYEYKLPSFIVSTMFPRTMPVLEYPLQCKLKSDVKKQDIECLANHNSISKVVHLQ